MHTPFRALITGAATGLLSVTASLLSPPAALAAPEEIAACLDAGDIWVAVQIDTEISGGCAPYQADMTGLDALTAIGVSFEAPDGFVCQLDAVPAACNDPNSQQWWSYWHNDPAPSGWTGWQSYLIGAGAATPQPGSIEGWRLAANYTDLAPPPDVAAPGSAEASASGTPSPSAASAQPSSSVEALTSPAASQTSPTASDAPARPVESAPSSEADNTATNTILGVVAVAALALMGGALVWSRRRSRR